MSDSDWRANRIDSLLPTEVADPYFDDTLQAWIFSRYRDVLSAFRSRSLMPASPSKRDAAPHNQASDTASMRAATQAALSPGQLQIWRERLQPVAQTTVWNLPVDIPVDLVSDYAMPLCLTLAAMVTKIDVREAAHLHKIAEPVSLSAAEPYDTRLKPAACAASAEIADHFPPGPEPLRESGFVGLSHTLPRLLTSAWVALILEPRQWALLHREPHRMSRAAEELLRHSGFPRILFRRAIEDTEVSGAHIRKGDGVLLRTLTANRDSDSFPDAENLCVRRHGAQHLALGAGPHACTGAGLIRMAVVEITHALVKRFAQARLAKPVEWKGGSGFQSPESLFVVLKGPEGQR